MLEISANTRILTCITYTHFGSGSSVGIATYYSLESPGIEYRWGEIFRPG